MNLAPDHRHPERSGGSLSDRNEVEGPCGLAGRWSKPQGPSTSRRAAFARRGAPLRMTSYVDGSSRAKNHAMRVRFLRMTPGREAFQQAVEPATRTNSRGAGSHVERCIASPGCGLTEHL